VVNIYRRFGGVQSLRIQGPADHTLLGLPDPDEGSSTLLRNNSKYLPIGTVKCHRNLEVSSRPLRETQIPHY